MSYSPATPLFPKEGVLYTHASEGGTSDYLHVLRLSNYMAIVKTLSGLVGLVGARGMALISIYR